MPDPKDNAKATGDLHPPEIEDDAGSLLGRPDAGGAEDGPPDSALSRDVGNDGRSGKSVNQAGVLKDKDAPGAGREKP
jgi:hypothetical protein